jgi:tripartite-type tricarboxylate transporter receptor subunit TctC
MKRSVLALVVAAIVALGLAGGAPLEAQSFFAGKTVRIIVGLAPGGGFDTYARLVARHLGKYIPGNPTVVVENMTGAGGLISANHLYRVAKPDGLALAHVPGTLLLGQVLGQPGVEFDARKFEYIGATVKEEPVCALTKASGITSIEQLMAAKTPVKIGAVAPGAPSDNTPRILKAALGLPIQVVTGYKGTAEIRLAAEGGEVAGACWAWESMRSTWRKALDAGEAIPILQVAAKPLADLPRVPVAISLAKTDEARRLIQVGIQDGSLYSRPFMAPPGTPKERVQILRKAFQEVLNDKALLAEADKAKLTLDPVSGEELEKLIAGLFTLDQAFVEKLKTVLYK